MSKRVPLTLAGLTCSMLVFGLALDLPFAYGQETKAPEWKYGLEFPVRKHDQDKFDKDTKRFGSEVFIDRNLNNVIYITQTGAVASLPGSAAPTGKDIKDPSRSHALVLKARKGGEKDFDKAEKYGVEIYKDENNGKLVYISETGSIAAGNGNTAGTEAKKPTWSHGLDLKVRNKNQENFDDNTKKWGVECYKDENTGLLVYVSESGSVALVSANLPTGEIKGPKWSHGFNFRVRKPGEEKTGKDTKTFGCEVFHDPNTNVLVYITETGDLAVVPGTPSPSAETKKPSWFHGMDFKVRSAGEKDFEKARKWGVEVFKDENAPNSIYISESGSIAVLPAK